MRYTGFTLTFVRPSVRPSVCPSVDLVSATFLQNYLLNSFHTWHLSLWGISLDPYRFSCSYLHFWPSGGQIFAKNCQKSGFPQLFSKNISSIHFIPGIYPCGVSLWTPIDFRVHTLIFGPLVAKSLPQIGVSATFLKNYWLN